MGEVELDCLYPKYLPYLITSLKCMMRFANYYSFLTSYLIDTSLLTCGSSIYAVLIVSDRNLATSVIKNTTFAFLAFPNFL